MWNLQIMEIYILFMILLRLWWNMLSKIMTINWLFKGLGRLRTLYIMISLGIKISLIALVNGLIPSSCPGRAKWSNAQFLAKTWMVESSLRHYKMPNNLWMRCKTLRDGCHSTWPRSKQSDINLVGWITHQNITKEEE